MVTGCGALIDSGEAAGCGAGAAAGGTVGYGGSCDAGASGNGSAVTLCSDTEACIVLEIWTESASDPSLCLAPPSL